MRVSDLDYYRLSLEGTEPEYPLLLEVSAFLYDFNLLYEICRLAVDPAYSDVNFSRNSVYRSGRRLRREDRLHVVTLSHSSPIQLTAVLHAAIPAAIALWGVAQAVQRLRVDNATIKKLNAEARQLEEQAKKTREETHQAKAISRKTILESEKLERELEKLEDQRTVYTPAHDSPTYLALQDVASSLPATVRVEIDHQMTRKSFLQRLRNRGAREIYDQTCRRLEKSPIEITELLVDIVRNLPREDE